MGNQSLSVEASSKGAQFLDEWTRLFSAVIAEPSFEYDNDRGSIRCMVIVPSHGKVQAEGNSVESATMGLMKELQHVLLESKSIGDWPSEWHRLASTVQIYKSGKHFLGTSLSPAQAHLSDSRAITKERQETIGVSCKRSLQFFISGMANAAGETAAQVARTLLNDGFEDFEERTLQQSPSRVFASFQKDYDQLMGNETTQWMVRTSPNLFIRIRLTAKEYGKSASQLSALCIAHAMVKQQVTEAELEKAQAQIAAFQGPKARQLSVAIGLGKHGALLNGVLAGRTVAPSRVLQLLSEQLKVTALALAETFRKSFALSPVPAFKAEDGKPFVNFEPLSWSAAIESLHLSADEAEPLLQLDD